MLAVPKTDLVGRVFEGLEVDIAGNLEMDVSGIRNDLLAEVSVGVIGMDVATESSWG